jgi:hypothetical protein
MPIESANYINQLVPSQPQGGESISEGDDHLRVIKNAVKQSFPNINAAVTSTPEDLNKVGALVTDVDSLKTDVDELKQNSGGEPVEYHGNVASAYYNPVFGAGALVYGHNIASVTNDGNGVTKVSYSTLLDGITEGNNDTGHYAVNLTPVTLTGKPVIIVLYGSVRSHLIFKSYELESDMTTWTEMAGGTCSFHLSVQDLEDGQ